MRRRVCVAVVVALVLPVSLRADEIGRETIQKMIKDYVAARAPHGMELVSWELVGGKSLPLQGTVQSLFLPKGSTWRSETLLGMRVKCLDGREETLWLSLRLEAPCRIVVTRRSLPLDHTITPEDVTDVTQDCGRCSGECYSDIQDVVGKQVRRPVARHGAIRKGSLKEATEIQKGAPVLIVAEKGVLRVEAAGRAMENGSRGEGIRVQNSTSGKELYGTVVDGTTVRIEF